MKLGLAGQLTVPNLATAAVHLVVVQHHPAGTSSQRPSSEVVYALSQSTDFLLLSIFCICWNSRRPSGAKGVCRTTKRVDY